MKKVDSNMSFSDKGLVDVLIKEIISVSANRSYNIMEVCGTHTMSISRTGLRYLLPKNINLLSGPGCPVCVTSQGDIELIFELVDRGVSILSFGDLLRIPSSDKRTLLKAKSHGVDVRVIYSPLDCIKIALNEPNKKFVFIGVGFETTAPTVAALIKTAYDIKVDNLSVLSFCKTMPEAIKLLLTEDIEVDGFLAPGHVTIVTGNELYEPIIEKRKAVAIAGFEPLEILDAILSIINQINSNEFKIDNKYKRVVTGSRNELAYKILNEVFEPCTLSWRGLGELANSGLAVRERYGKHDAMRVYSLTAEADDEIKGCRCGDVLKGKITPQLCPLFGKLCTTETPIGPCMVSSEGTCSAYYKYGDVDYE